MIFAVSVGTVIVFVGFQFVPCVLRAAFYCGSMLGDGRAGGGNEGGLNSFINGALVGRNAAEFVAVAANAPGPLELIPMPDYDNGEAWWIFARPNGDPVVRQPKSGNAYDDIYTNSKWYGLVPDENLLDPAGIVKERLEKNKSK